MNYCGFLNSSLNNHINEYGYHLHDTLKLIQTFDPTDLTNYTTGLRCYDSYGVSGTPTTYGNVLEINALYANHWKPQLWFDGDSGTGRVRYRNKGYDATSWGSWYELAYTSDIPKFSYSNGTLTITT